jgi:AcrR family transcriptional regulator
MKNPEHRVQTTKRMFRNALLAFLTEKPLRSITVKELCERAGLNRGTFYAHYADVYDLLGQIEAEMETDFSTALEPMLSVDDGQLTPPKVTKKVFECIEANADLCRVIIGPFGDKEFGRRLIRESKDNVVQSCRQYFPNADEWQINVYYTFISGGCFALMERWIREGMVERPEVLANAAEQIMESGAAFLR